MKIKKILVQYFHIATKVLIELLSVRAGLYVKQNQLPKKQLSEYECKT